MSDKLAKNNKTIRKSEAQEIREKALQYVRGAEVDPGIIIDKLREEILPAIENDDADPVELSEKYSDELKKVSNLLGLDNHFPLAGTVLPDKRVLVIEFANRIVDEYNCETSIERSLAEVVAGSFVRYLQYSKALTLLLDGNELYPEKTRYFSAISKELNRAQRQYISAINTLRQLKAPTIDLKVNARTAYLAEKQQVNMYAEVNEADKINAPN